MRICITVLLVLALAGLAFAADSPHLTDVSNQQIQPFQVVDLQVDESGITATLDIEDPTWLGVDGADGSQLEFAAFPLSGALDDAGMPYVPVAASLFRIPPRSGVVVEVIGSEYVTYSDVEYAALFSDELNEGPETAIQYTSVSNNEDSWYPGTLAEVGEPAIMHDFRVANLVTYPVQVNPARNEVRVYSSIRVQIRYEGVDDRNTLAQWPNRLSRRMVPMYEAFLDWELDELNDYEFYDGTVAVVMVDDDALWTAMEDWIEWKREKGWRLDFITDSDIGWSATNIRNELISRYETMRDPYDYVVVIGDDQGAFAVPAGSGGCGEDNGDQPYCCLVGNDNLADLGSGRISVQTVAQAAAYVAKLLLYERDVDFDNTDWYLRAMLNRANTNGGGISKIIMHRYYKYLLLNKLGFTQVDTVNWGGQDPFAQECIDNGVSLYAERGYYGQGLSIDEVYELENDYMTPVVIDVTCATGCWSGGLAISEAFMLHGTVGTPRGGVVCMAMSTAMTHPNFNNVLSGASGWGMLQMQFPTPGDLMYVSKVNCYVNYNGRDNEMDRFLRWYNCMGDPLVYMWTDIPHQFDVEASETLTLGQREYTVTVEEDGEPVVDAWVTFYKDSGQDEVQISKYTDANGQVTFYPEVISAGAAKVTVTKLNFAPTQVDVSVGVIGGSVGYSDFEFIDNGMTGTIGDGDGIPEAGERIGIQMTLKNYGNETLTDISVTGDIDDPYITDTFGEITLASLEQNQTSLGSGLIIVEIAPAAQDRWIVPVHFTIETSAGTVTDGIEMSLSAPNFVVTQAAFSGELQPGTVQNVAFTLGNAGLSDGAAGTALLVSMDPWLRVTQPTGTVPAIEINEENVTSEFTVAALEDGFPGYSAKTMLVVTTETGQVDTAYANIIFGERAPTDPIGPDNYGYMGFENVDTDYEYAPTFDWVEINSAVNGYDFEGIEIDIEDLSEDDDEGDTLNLEVHGFPITYYGQTFDYISITTNGFLALGLQPSICNNRNWSIPTPGGPNDMIAPYWDNLQTNGDCKILYYHDEDDGRMIFEFYKMRHHNTSYESTFEVIFYDTEMYPTRTGDNEFVFQYGECDHSSGGMSFDVPYWTTGIENGDQTDGLLVAYWNEYSPGSSAITEGRAIKFTTNTAIPFGGVYGTVTDSETNSPIEGACVHTSNWLFSGVTDAQGEYLIEDMFVGVHDFVIEADCYNPVTLDGVEVLDGANTEASASLTHPEFDLSTTELSIVAPPDSEMVMQFDITNDGNGPLYYDASLHFPNEAMLNSGGDNGNRGPVRSGNELDENWDVIGEFELSAIETRYHGVIFDGEFFWVSGSDNYDVAGPNKLYQYDENGSYVATFDQPVPASDRSSQGFFGMAWDGEYLYAADNGIMYQMEFDGDSWTSVDSWDIPANPARYIVLDPNTYNFYVGDYGTQIRVINPDSTGILYEFTQTFYPRGGGWFPEDDDGYSVYFIGQASGEAEVNIIKMNPTTGDLRPVHTFLCDDGYTASGGDITYLWDPSVWQYISILESSDIDKVDLWEIDTYSNWISIQNPTGTVAAGETETVELRLHSYGLPADTFTVAVEISHNACTEDQEWVDVTMIVDDGKGLGDQPTNDLPTEFSFDGAYPNPFNPIARVKFGLPETAVVKATVFNLLGQKVATLANQPMQAGFHQLTFDGSNLASGMYFLNFQAGPINETTRLILMK